MRNTDLCVGRGDSTFRSRDVRAPLEQLGRHARRDERRLAQKRHARQRKLGRRLTDQDRDRVLELRSRYAHIEQLRLGRFQLCVGLHHIQSGDDASVISVLRQRQRLLVCAHRIFQNLLLRIERTQGKIVLCQLRLKQKAARLDVSSARLCTRDVRFNCLAHAAPEIGLPRRIEGSCW